MNKDVHGGNVNIIKNCSKEDIKYDFSVNLNPLGLSDSIDKFLISMPHNLVSDYPEVFANSAEMTIANYHNVKSENIVLGNGATEIFNMIIQAFKPKKVLCPSPTYSGYEEVCNNYNINITHENLYLNANNKEKFANSAKDYDLIFIGYPNNPTGNLISKEFIKTLISINENILFVIDESFMDFVADSANYSFINTNIHKNVIVVKSLTKFYSIAGVRLGYAYGHQNIISKLRKVSLPWSVNGIAQNITPLLFADKKYIENTISQTCELRSYLVDKLKKIKEIKIYKSEVNFLLCELRNIALSAKELQEKLLKEHNIFIRDCSNIIGLNNKFFRIAVKNKKTNIKLINALYSCFNETNKIEDNKSKANAIMIVGTTSDSGKSVITAAFCRYLKRKNKSVAPFKAQNMSLNSFVTKEGGEMGRAQVVQADAAKVEPHTDMNPVLLKPLGNTKSQLIVNGKSIGNYTAKEYYTKKCDVRNVAFTAYDRLANNYEYIVLEGAGSPAEINLLNEDFVNMRMAQYANAYTILVADIDRGGVFASILGTIKLIPKKWRHLIKGIIINKFRGDKSLLTSGIKEIEKLTQIPVLGVMPYIENLNIEEEDSLGLEKRLNNIIDNNCIDVAVIRLPRLSNYTDFLPLENETIVNLRYMSQPKNLGTPDIVIIPGTKNVISDMKFLRESGFEIKLQTMRTSQTIFIGICGGYQMLGKTIEDPNQVEGDCPIINALNFLPVKTTLNKEKELSQVEGNTTGTYPFSEKSVKFKGYEIHCGETTVTKEKSPLTLSKRKNINCNEAIGHISEDKLVFGSYIHGIFDSDELRAELIKHIIKKTGKKDVIKTPQKKQDPYEILADVLEENVSLHFFI